MNMHATVTAHVEYPHHPGYLYDCPACESRCHCDGESAPCVWAGHVDEDGAGTAAGSVTHLSLSWGVSRGRETDGYNIARLVDDTTGKRYRCMGGGYDMQGTVFADWLCDVHQDRLRAIGHRAHRFHADDGKSAVTQDSGLYGMTRYADGRVSVDGACGLESVRRIAEACDLDVRTVYGPRNGLKAIIVTAPDAA